MYRSLPPSPPITSGSDKVAREAYFAGDEDPVKQTEIALRDQLTHDITIQPTQEKTMMQCHRLAIEALQNLFVEEHRRCVALEEQTKQKMRELEQELASQKQQTLRSQKKVKEWERQMNQICHLVDVLFHMSSATSGAESHLPHAKASPATIQDKLRDVLDNVIEMQHHLHRQPAVEHSAAIHRYDFPL